MEISRNSRVHRVPGIIGLAGILCCGLLLQTPDASALPQGYQTTAGNVSIQQSGKTMEITSGSARSIVNYQQFNIANDETVNFHLPGTMAAILNRVVGGVPSEILGAMNANGQVFLVNPSGILFGASAQVNVGSLFASTLAITDADFLAGNLSFHREYGASPAAIVNHGNISVQPGGVIMLAAAALENTGTLSAPLGAIHMAVGESLRVQMDDGVTVRVNVDEALKEKVTTLDTSILNLGTLEADGGLVSMVAEMTQTLYQKAINNEGVVRANSVSNTGGKLSFYASHGEIQNSGHLEASGTETSPDGGSITLIGPSIEHRGSILANAAERGTAGTLSLRSSESTVLASGSTTQARAVGSTGNGGEIIIWSDSVTELAPQASILAQGGSVSGDGGFIELSAKEKVIWGGLMDAAGYNGKPGTILIDPTDIVIDGVGGGDTVDSPGNAEDVGTGSCASGATGNCTLLNTIVENFANNLHLIATNDITVLSPITMVAGAFITLQADRHITISADITTTNQAISLLADADGVGGGNLTIDNGVTLSSSGGNITLAGDNAFINGTVNAGTGRIMLTAASDVTIDGLAGTGKLISTGAAGAANAETIVVDAGGDVNLIGGAALESGSIVASNGNIRVDATGNSIILNGGAGNNSGSLLSGSNQVLISDRLELNGAGGDQSGSVVAGGNVSITAVGIPFLGPDGMIFDDVGSALLGACDDCTSGLENFGFDFDFFGTTGIASGRVVSNGYLWMGNNTATTITFLGLPRTEATGKIALFQTDLNTVLGGTIGFKSTGTEFVTTFRDASDVDGTGVVNGQIGLLSSGNSLGLREGTIVLSYGDTQTTAYNTTNTGIGLNAGNGSDFQTLNDLGIGASNGSVTAGQLAGLSGRSFAFVPDGSGNYSVMELPTGTGGGIVLTGGGGTSSGTILSTGGNIRMTTNGDITFTAGAGPQSGSLITSGAARTIDIEAGGTVTFNAGTSATTNNGTLTIDALSLDIGGMLDAGTGTVVLKPYDHVDIAIADNADGDGDDEVFDINAAELGQITAGTLTIGTGSKRSNISLLGAIDVSGAGPAGVYDLDFESGGNYGATGQGITLGTHSLTVDATGTINTGTVSGGAANISFTGGNVLTVDGPVSVTGAGTITLSTTSNDAIVLNDSVGGGATTTIDAHGTGNISQTAGTVTSDTINLASDSGHIGSSGAAISINADTLTTRTDGSGDIFIVEADTVSIGNSEAGDRLQIRADNAITTTGSITADDVHLETTANNGAITLDSDVTGDNTVTLIAHGSGQIRETGGIVSGGSLSVTSDTGNIRLETDVDSITASTGGNITVHESDGIAITTGNLSGANVTITTTIGDIEVNGVITGNQVYLNAGGSILDGNGSANNLNASSGATLKAGQVIGLLSGPFDVAVTGGKLNISALGEVNGVSVNINGSVSPIDTLTRLNAPPGKVIYNGLLLYPLTQKQADEVTNAINTVAFPYITNLERDDFYPVYIENRLVESFLLHPSSPRLAPPAETTP